MTATPTFSVTYTATTINTYVKPGYLLTVKVYNEAGEVVRTITTVSTDYVLTGIITSVGGNTANGFSSGEVLTTLADFVKTTFIQFQGGFSSASLS
jgi:hypothetical protein